MDADGRAEALGLAGRKHLEGISGCFGTIHLILPIPARERGTLGGIIETAAKGCYLMGRMPGPLDKPEVIIGFGDDRDAWDFLGALAAAIRDHREVEPRP